MARRVHHIIPTFACNNNCGYCITRELVDDYNKISLDDMRIILNNLARWEKTGRVIITWYGGEPMMMPVSYYGEVVKLQKEITGSTGIVFENHMQTNLGLLDREWIRFLLNNHFGIRTSINPGVERTDKQGRNTLPVVLENIKIMRGEGVNIRAICVVCENDSAGEIHGFFEEHGIDYKVNPVMIPDSMSSCRPGISPESYGSFLSDLFNIVNSGEVTVKSAMTDIHAASVMFGRTMYSHCPDAVSGILPDLDIYPCENLTTEFFRVGNHKTQVDDPFDSESYKKISRRDFNKMGCSGCELLPMCNGGCRHWCLTTGGSVSSKPPFCESFKMSLNHIAGCIMNIMRKENYAFAGSLGQVQLFFRNAEEVPGFLTGYLKQLWISEHENTKWNYQINR